MCVIVLQIYSDDLEANCKPTNGSLSYSMCMPKKNNLYYRQFFWFFLLFIYSNQVSDQSYDDYTIS